MVIFKNLFWNSVQDSSEFERLDKVTFFSLVPCFTYYNIFHVWVNLSNT